MSRIKSLTIFLLYIRCTRPPRDGVLLMTVSSDGVDGRPAGVGGRTSHSRGRVTRTRGHYDPRALRAVGLLSLEATAEEPFTCDEVLPALRALQGAYRWSKRISTPRRAAPAPPFSTEGRPSLPGGSMPPPQRMAHIPTQPLIEPVHHLCRTCAWPLQWRRGGAKRRPS